LDYISDTESYVKYLEQKRYPELFRQAERDVDGRLKLIDLIKSLLSPSDKNRGVLYELISNWPFACYLTTNYDDEMKDHLAGVDEHFTVIRNRPEDFYSLRNGVSHLIQKLHSDLDHPEEVILTSTDYRRLYVEDSGQYFRDKLRQVFEIFDVFIIGHSLSDPDINYILQLARKTASPQHPIYMAAEDFTKAEEKDYFEKYNIILMGYSNQDGTHSKLRRMLKIADRFIVPRRRRRERTEAEVRPKEEVEAAVALFLYRRLKGAEATENLSPLILANLHSADAGELSKEEIIALPSLKAFAQKGVVFSEAIDESLDGLVRQSLIDEVSGRYSISKKGRESVKECQAVRETEKDQAYGQFSLSLKAGCASLTDMQLEECKKMAEEVIVASFATRGLTISNQIFAGQTGGPEELSDVFGFVSDTATALDDMELKAAFVDAMHQFLVEPSPPQRKYLASVSQGYFLYHLLGLDPKCRQLRRDIFKRTLWLCDSNVLLPLAAAGCHNHDYAVELFRTLKESEAVLYTTPNLLQEAWEHFDWALNFMKHTGGAESPEFLRTVLLKGSSKQNLFLDGYIRLSADGQVASFKDYLDLVTPKGIDRSSFNSLFINAGVSVGSVSEMTGFVQDDWGDIEEAKDKIQQERERVGIYRSSLQVESEAEVWVFVKNLRSGKYSIPGIDTAIERVYFISQSRVLDKVFQPESVATWTPEAVYRYLSALPGSQTNPDLLQQCMLHEYYYAGVSFIDKDRYVRFFGPSIDAAKASYEKEKSKYIAELEESHAKQLDDAFDKVPDLEKPFFVAQMGWRVAEASKHKEEQAKQRELEWKAKARLLEEEKKAAWKKQEKRRKAQEAATERNLKDPKHVRKRLKQAKKRRRKKK